MKLIKITKLINDRAYLAVKPENIFEWIAIRRKGYVKMSQYSICAIARCGFYAKYSKEDLERVNI